MSERPTFVEELRQHIAVDPIVREALRGIMAIVADGWRGRCGCQDLRECGRCQGLDLASDRIETIVRDAVKAGRRFIP